ncbi:hypothetical protein LWI28_004895 [Acer negundo]|uniref:Uncharacterized protein n=1 Tax=Acer negundo TaxID=4023 RepID=A0AAD5JGQ8_ACENE|nr:hypothetical protein LWI28_004895 [Acer negundo]
MHVVYLKEVDLLASLMVQSSSRRAPFLLGPQRQNVGLVLTVNHGRNDSYHEPFLLKGHKSDVKVAP